jgi:hypothetical protein
MIGKRHLKDLFVCSQHFAYLFFVNLTIEVQLAIGLVAVQLSAYLRFYVPVFVEVLQLFEIHQCQTDLRYFPCRLLSIFSTFDQIVFRILTIDTFERLLMNDNTLFQLLQTVNFIEIDAAHLHAEGTVGEDVHDDGEDDLLRRDEVDLRHQILLLVVVEEQILGLGNDRDQLL